MSLNSGTRVIDKIVPTDSLDTYPTHDSFYGLGGHREVNTITDLFAIPTERRRIGMTCYVISGSSGQTTYRLEGGTDNSSWNILNFSSPFTGGTVSGATTFISGLTSLNGNFNVQTNGRGYINMEDDNGQGMFLTSYKGGGIYLNDQDGGSIVLNSNNNGVYLTNNIGDSFGVGIDGVVSYTKFLAKRGLSATTISATTISIDDGSISGASLNFLSAPKTGIYRINDGIGFTLSGMSFTVKSPATGATRGHFSFEFPGAGATTIDGIDFGFRNSPKNYTFSFGDTIIHNNDYGIGFGSTINLGYVSQAFGFNINATGDFSIALGNEVDATALQTFALGQYISATATKAFVFGIGYDNNNRLINNIPNSVMFASVSNLPTIFISGGTGLNNIGTVSIGHTAPTARLDIYSGNSVVSPFRIRLNSSDKPSSTMNMGEFQFKTNRRFSMATYDGVEQEFAFLSDLTNYSGVTGTYYSKSGNTFSSNAFLGLNDNYNLSIGTQGNSNITIGSSGVTLNSMTSGITFFGSSLMFNGNNILLEQDILDGGSF